MELLTLAVSVSLILSLASIILTIIAMSRLYRYAKVLVDEVGLHIVMHKRYKRVKRYVLVKFLCIDNSFERLTEDIEQAIDRLLGSILRSRCSIDVVSYRPEKKRAILRVQGESVCVIYTLLALTIQHLEKDRDSCIAIPIRVSGLISRLRRRYLKS